jgi:hypothetical protein
MKLKTFLPGCPNAALVAFSLIVFVGCTQPSLDPAQLAQYRQELLLADEPEGSQTVSEVRAELLGTSPEDHDHGDHDHADHDHADHDHADHDDHAHGDHDHSADVPDDEEAAPAEESGEHAHAEHDHAEHDHGDPTTRTPIVSDLEREVVMIGAVGGLPNPAAQTQPDFPFAKGQALFFLADPSAVAEQDEHAHQHAPGEECAFCAAHAGDSSAYLAVVRFRDKQGKLLKVDSRDLFELKEREMVVVRGVAKIEGGMLVVDASDLYIRR